MKPGINAVLRIMQMKAEVAKLYAEIDQRVQALHREFGEGRFDYDIHNSGDIEGDVLQFAGDLCSNGDYIKFQIIDNIAALQEGKAVFKSTSISPVSFVSGSLKRCPQSLKE